jgi:hypothetical protein
MKLRQKFWYKDNLINIELTYNVQSYSKRLLIWLIFNGIQENPFLSPLGAISVMQLLPIAVNMYLQQKNRGANDGCNTTKKVGLNLF